MTDSPAETFRLGYVPGATPGKWARTWRDRLAVHLELVQLDVADTVAALERGDVDAAIGRLPVDKTRLSAIALYDELPVVVVSRDHLLAATDEDETVTSADIADDVVHLPADDVLYPAGAALPGLRPAAYREDGSVDPAGVAERPATTAEAVAWVAAGAGVTIVPMSLARLHHRKDVTHRVLDGGPTAPVGLVWVSERTTDLVDEMIGVVRGRTVNSSRGRGAARRDDGGGAPAPDGGRRGADHQGGPRADAGGAARGGARKTGRGASGKASRGGAARSPRGGGTGSGTGGRGRGAAGKGRRGR